MHLVKKITQNGLFWFSIDSNTTQTRVKFLPLVFFSGRYNILKRETAQK